MTSTTRKTRCAQRSPATPVGVPRGVLEAELRMLSAQIACLRQAVDDRAKRMSAMLETFGAQRMPATGGIGRVR